MLFSGFCSSPQQQFRTDYNESIFVSIFPIASQKYAFKSNQNDSTVAELSYTSVQVWKKPQESVTVHFVTAKHSETIPGR